MERKFEVPVLLIFFCRDEVLRQVFECVKRVKPTKLYLYQDGPRNESDMRGIEACRHIVSQIDWDCEVHKYYQEKNVGCDPSEYIAQKWMFEKEERGIVLEDDDVVSDSFFYFCEELLERYKDDERINMICGMNHLGHYDKPGTSYIFTKTVSITSWASWKRVIDTWDPNYSFIDDEYQKYCLKNLLGKYYDRVIRTWKMQKESGKAHYEGILGSNMYLNNRLNIVPTCNLVKNIGLTPDATHTKNTINTMPRGLRCIFFAPIYELDFPLKHPKTVTEDIGYEKLIRAIVSPNSIITFLRKIERRIYKIFPFLGR